jgi:dolichol-phosphate mannosyltransferase
MDYRLANIVAILAASVSNFLANDRWTFRRKHRP